MKQLRNLTRQKLKELKFEILSEGPMGFLARRKSTGKLIGVVWPYCPTDPTRMWVRYKIHPFMAFVDNTLKFRDLLSLEDLNAI